MKCKLIILSTIVLIPLFALAEITIAQLKHARAEYESALQKYETTLSEQNLVISQLEEQKAVFSEQLEINNTKYAELKPKSLKAKKLAKQISKIEEQIAILSTQIDLAKNEISTCNRYVVDVKTSYENLQKQYDDEQLALHEYLEQIDQRIKSITAQETSDNTLDISEEKNNSIITSTNEVDEEDNDFLGKFASILFIGIIVIIMFRRRFRCPHCGHWFCMESQGDVHVWEHDTRGSITRRGFRKRRICRRCGGSSSIIEWNTTK